MRAARVPRLGSHFFPLRFGFPASRMAIATACEGFFPALRSARMFAEIPALVFAAFPRFNGMGGLR